MIKAGRFEGSVPLNAPVANIKYRYVFIYLMQLGIHCDYPKNCAVS
ncbi:hypothetical protein P3T33_003854 [Rhizobium sp. AN67]|nr:hypothetical protein [Rhizobium sp. AN67]SOD50812.1 hypothetical protein SAMN05216595_0363 [Rhizobium sp. AN6A]